MSLQLIGTNKANSTLLTYDGNTQQVNLYSAFGSVDNVQNGLLPGFNGERPDPLTGVSHLGNGYRAYNPILMRFTCPDNESPFGAGGINPYAYCQNDPVNVADPSGHGFIFRLVRRGLTALLKHFVEDEVAKSMAKQIAKFADNTITYGTQITSAATDIAAYNDAGDDPQKAMKLEKVGKALGLINAVVTIINAPINLVKDFKELRSRSGSFKPEEAINESLVMTSNTMKQVRKMEWSGTIGKLAIKGVEETESFDNYFAINEVLELSDIDNNALQRLKHGTKDLTEAFLSHDLDTVEDVMQHDQSIRTRPMVIYNITSNILSLASTGFAIAATATEKSNAFSSEESFKISDALGATTDIMSISENIQKIKRDAGRYMSLLYKGMVLLGGKII